MGSGWRCVWRRGGRQKIGGGREGGRERGGEGGS